uniref:Uncharacterized protein n=1 Tax=Ciona intestinalis TaxID=7719 RepID=F6VMU8_CIOIN
VTKIKQTFNTVYFQKFQRFLTGNTNFSSFSIGNTDLATLVRASTLNSLVRQSPFRHEVS